jgi:outer membrane protein assembly factor BamB
MKLLLSVSLLLAGSALAADWMQFRGPNSAGLAADANVPTTWSDAQNLAWKTALPGRGSSSPIVCGDFVFVTCYAGYGDGAEGGSVEKLKRHLLCLERKTGKLVWDKSVPATLPEDPFHGFITEHGYASSTPVTDGQRIYAFFGKTGALAFDFAGKQLWQVNLGKQSSNRRWGSAASPILYKNMVIINASEEGRAIFALDAATGKQVWRAESEGLELSYSTPILIEDGNGRTSLIVAVPNQVWALNPDTGKTRWYADTGIGGNVSPTVMAGNGMIYITGGFPAQGTIAIRCGGRGDVTSSNVVWKSEVASYVPSPVLHDGKLFVVSDGGFAICLDAKTGQTLHRERLPDFTTGGRGSKPVYASTLLVGKNLLAITRRKGAFILAATPEMKVLAHNTLSDDSDFNATPAVSGSQFFLRSNRYLYCVGRQP